MPVRDKTNAERQRRHRERLRAGDVFVQGDVTADAVERLIGQGCLQEWDAAKPHKILEAMQAFVLAN